MVEPLFGGFRQNRCRPSDTFDHEHKKASLMIRRLTMLEILLSKHCIFAVCF